MIVLLLACAPARKDLDVQPFDSADSATSPDSGDSTPDTDTHTTDSTPGDSDPTDSGPTDSGTTSPDRPRRVVGYYTNWSVYARGYLVTDIPADHLTHLNYAFLNLAADGTCSLGDSYADIDLFYPGDCWDAGCERGNFHQLALLKADHPDLKVLLSVGGWTWSDHFSTVAADATARATFARSCVDLVDTYGFDGLDIDWEYPVEGGECADCGSPGDVEAYPLLLDAVRAEMATRRSGADEPLLLTLAVGAPAERLDDMDLPAVMPLVDWVNVMAYDFHGPWESTTNHAAALYPSTGDPGDVGWNTSVALDGWIAAGADPAQLVMGIPFYGHGWSGVPATNDGLFQSSTGVPPGTWEAGSYDWQDLAANYLPTWTRHWSDEAQAPWIYRDGVMISYEDADSIAAKTAFIRDRGLGGAMFWELSADDDAATLQGAVWAGVME